MQKGFLRKLRISRVVYFRTGKIPFCSWYGTEVIKPDVYLDGTLADALRKVYDSKLFGQVNDPETGLYREGPLFLYGMLCEEQHDETIAPTHVAG